MYMCVVANVCGVCVCVRVCVCVVSKGLFIQFSQGIQ